METDITQLEKDLRLKYPAISVSQLSEYLSRKMRADEFLSKIYVVGEISNLADKGHIHFKLKDQSVLINCIMFSSNRDNIENEIDNGKEVLVGGSIRYYPKYGTAQIIVKSIFPLKEGYKSLTKKRIEQKLKSEGLFKSENKKEIPKIPSKIGVLTAEESRAMYDFKNTVENRFPNISLKFRNVRVQGEQSPESIVQGIKDLDSQDDVDVIVLTRGGGSEEDLESFDDERVVRAIYESKKPTISAIGHEDDCSLADYAADKRAMTPTDAGRISVLDQEEILREIENYETSLYSSYKEFKQRIAQSQKIKLYKRILIGLATALGIGLLIFLYKIL